MNSDLQVFVLPNKDRIEVHADGTIIHIGLEADNPYPTETDISGSRLGLLLRSVLLEAPLKSLPSQERPLNLVSKVSVVSEGSLVADTTNLETRFLRQEVKQTLLNSGIPAQEVEFFDTVAIYVKYLNNSSNPVKTAQTFRNKDTYSGRFTAWAKRHPKHSAAAPDKLCPCGKPAIETGYCSGACDMRYNPQTKSPLD